MSTLWFSVLSAESPLMSLISIVLLSYLGLAICVAIIIVSALYEGYPVVW